MIAPKACILKSAFWPTPRFHPSRPPKSTGAKTSIRFATDPTLRLMVRDRTSCWSAWHAKVSVSLVSGGVSGRYSCRGRQRRTSVRALLARSERCNRVRVLLLNFKTMFEEDDTQRDSKQTHTYHQPQHCIPQEFQRPWKRFSTIIRWQALNVKPLFGILCANPRDLDPHLHL